MLVATVFDLDETLVDSAETWNRVIGAVAERHGQGWTADDWTAIQGTSVRHWSGYLAHRCRDLTPESAAAECADGMIDALEGGRIGLLPGAADLVAAAAGLGPIGLVSAAPGGYVRAAARTFRLDFATMVTGEDVEHGKPAPDPYHLAAQRLGVDPAGCLAVEDSGSGIRSAHAAGMTVLAIPNPATALDLDVLELADHYATDAHIAAKALPSLVGL
ncbi:HAD family hydrolase [Amycolatopsis pittospori]|uniref:HAD family hydrolase n=1 Tax=Amycolatopsis pittospori TaxID=2749434 RepID=UPI0015F0A084|nr:HAD family phosphatase [Amycolatopsis pittospori]